MAKSVLNLAIVTNDAPASVAEQYITNRADYPRFIAGLQKFMAKLAGISGGKIVAWVDGSTDGSTEKAGDAQTATVTITHANVTTGDTLTIGGTTLTWDTDMAIGSDAGDDGDNLATAINASATLAGLFSAASDGNGVVTITAYGAPRVLRSFGLTKVEASAGMALSAAHFGLDTTDTSAVDPITVSSGVS
jgi:hypothetical protein